MHNFWHIYSDLALSVEKKKKLSWLKQKVIHLSAGTA